MLHFCRQRDGDYAAGQRVGMRVGCGPIQYLFGDPLGSTILTTDANFANPATIRYNAWGTVRYTTGTTPAANAFGYTGQRQQSDIGLSFYNARWYDSYLNRWTQPDPIIQDPYNPQDYDRYAYVRNNPVNYTDPTGLDACMAWNGDKCMVDEDGGTYWPGSQGDKRVTQKESEAQYHQRLRDTFPGTTDSYLFGDFRAFYSWGLAGQEYFEGSPYAQEDWERFKSSGGPIQMAAFISPNFKGESSPGVYEVDLAYNTGQRTTGDFPVKSNTEYQFRESSDSDTAGFAKYDLVTGRVIYRVDLEGPDHGGISTPHLHTASWNIDPVTGLEYFNGWGRIAQSFNIIGSSYNLLFGKR